MATPIERDQTFCNQFELTLEVPFPSQREVSIAIQSLCPDREPRTGTTKTLRVSSNTLSVKWTADEARILRVSVGSFLDHLALVMETMEAFGQTVPL
ncbi:L antigen family member 3-like [Trichomycterus rosablanca]|uniref:L antigen family member 3-like n=1 Tax=Trichomycterus rosablanca TaxID=2290929 RepID=UPI002F360B19